MRVDRIHNSIIGKGEDPTKEFLKEYFGLEEFNTYNVSKGGVYPQVPIPLLLNNEQIQHLREDHGNSSVDLVVLLNIGGLKCSLCVRVQGDGHGKGQKGWSKSRFDDVQERMLENSGHIVINIYKRDCPNLWKDVLNDKSRQEIIDSFSYKFPLPRS